MPEIKRHIGLIYSSLIIKIFVWGGSTPLRRRRDVFLDLANFDFALPARCNALRRLMSPYLPNLPPMRLSLSHKLFLNPAADGLGCFAGLGGEKSQLFIVETRLEADGPDG